MTNEEYYALMKLDNVVEHTFIANYVILIWLLLMWLMRMKTKAISPLFLEKEGRYDFSNVTSNFVVFLTIFPLVIWAAFRDDIQDTLNYRLTYSATTTGFSSVLSVINNDAIHEKGFSIFLVLIKSIFGDNEIAFLGICALLTLVLISYVYRRVSAEYSMSMFLFFISCDYYSWILNGMRQGMAVALVFVASLMLFDKKYVRFILLLLLAISFHTTSVVLIIALVLVKQKPWSRISFLVSIGFVVAFFVLTRRVDLIVNLFEDTQYSYAVNVIAISTNGVHPLRVLVYSIPTIIAFFARKQIREMDDSIINFATNMSFIGTLFYILAMFTSAIFIGRFPIYFTVWNYVLLAWELNYLFEKKSQQNIVKVTMVMLYLVFNLYQIYTDMSVYF